MIFTLFCVYTVWLQLIVVKLFWYVINTNSGVYSISCDNLTGSRMVFGSFILLFYFYFLVIVDLQFLNLKIWPVKNCFFSLLSFICTRFLAVFRECRSLASISLHFDNFKFIFFCRF